MAASFVSTLDLIVSCSLSVGPHMPLSLVEVRICPPEAL